MVKSGCVVPGLTAQPPVSQPTGTKLAPKYVVALLGENVLMVMCLCVDSDQTLALRLIGS